MEQIAALQRMTQEQQTHQGTSRREAEKHALSMRLQREKHDEAMRMQRERQAQQPQPKKKD
jgi:hypothetical protein